MPISYAHLSHVTYRYVHRYDEAMTTVQEAGKKGGKARARGMTKKQRVDAARKAGVASGIKRKKAN